MKLKDNVNVAELLKDAQKCTHDVYLRTNEGDQLNLKSTLSQYVLVVLAGNKEILKIGEIIYDPEDEETLKYYITE